MGEILGKGMGDGLLRGASTVWSRLFGKLYHGSISMFLKMGEFYKTILLAYYSQERH